MKCVVLYVKCDFKLIGCTFCFRETSTNKGHVYLDYYVAMKMHRVVLKLFLYE